MVQILELIWQSVWFILPAYLANMSPVFISKILGGDKWPLDFGKDFFDGKRILGPGKTWPGLIGGSLVGMAVAFLQSRLLLVGFLLGFGALFGDAAKSFFKRRLGIARGKSWPVADQLDFVIGAMLFVSLVEPPTWQIVLVVLVLTPIVHLGTNIIGYLLGLKKVWY